MAKRKIDGIDSENATNLILEIFPGASLTEMVEHAERTQRNLATWGKTCDAEVMERVASTIRRRLPT
jgi:hypothetical protein